MSESLIIIITALALAVALRIHTDYQQARIAHRLRRAVAMYIHEHYRPRTSILIELRRNADTIMPLLDHLYSQIDESVEIFVLIKQTAGKNAQPKLAYYRKKNQRKQLHLIKHRRGMSLETLRHTHTTGDIIMALESHDRLSPRFFDVARPLFIDPQVTAIIPNRQYQVTNTIIGALRVSAVAWRQTARQFTAPRLETTTITPGILYRRLTSADARVRRFAGATIVSELASPSLDTDKATRASWAHMLFVSLWVALAYAAINAYIVYGDTMSALWLAAIFIIVCGASLRGIHARSQTQKLSVLLLAPFVVPYDIASIVAQIIRPPLRAIGRKFARNIRNVFGALPALRTKRR